MLNTLDETALEREIQQAMEVSQTPGLALAIVRGQEVVYARGFGVTSVEDGQLPVTPQTLFCIGSVTKSLVGTALMRLIEQEILHLDTSICHYLPWLRQVNHAMQHVTLRQLLSHTAGLPHRHITHGPRSNEAVAATIQQEIAHTRLIAPSGKIYVYSNLGFVLAGHIAEVVTQKQFPDLMQELIFSPLHMTRTFFDRTVAMTYPLALPHELDRTGAMRVKHTFVDNAVGNPAGLALSTILDLSKFALLYHGEGCFGQEKLLNASTLAEMQRPQAIMHTPMDIAYGLSWFIAHYRGQRCVMHYGSMMSYMGEIRFFPDEKLAIIALSNFTHNMAQWNIVTRISDKLLQSPERASHPQLRFIPPVKSNWSKYYGTFVCREVGLIQIALDKEQLVLIQNKQIFPLQALKEHTYSKESNSGYICFVVEDEEEIQYLFMDEHFFVRVANTSTIEVSISTLKIYEGFYRLTNGQTVTVTMNNGQLWITIHWKQQAFILQPLSETCFVYSSGLIEFQMEETPHPILNFRGIALGIYSELPQT